MEFTEEELLQIKKHGVNPEKVEKDIQAFIKGTPFAKVISAATHNHGIEVFSEDEKKEFVEKFEEKKESLMLVKFVPASGAATRMFKDIHQFVNTYDPETEKLNDYLKEDGRESVKKFLKGVSNFPFIKVLRKKTRKQYPDFKFYSKGKRAWLLAKTLLEEKGLHYGDMPKGLIPFHKYAKLTATAFEEQLLEAGKYAESNGDCYVHFTFSEEHVNKFKEEFVRIKKRIERKSGCTFHISYSFQKPSTDTIAVTLDNRPFKDEEGKFHFRPAGHGALIENLNKVDADMIFIKNIDNVVVENELETVAYHKKVLAGKLLQVQDRIFNYLKQLEAEKVSTTALSEMQGFLAAELNIKKPPADADGIKALLNRPLRICGMVRNTGAPGGGPFWVKDEEGNISLQIVELSQINTEDRSQQGIVNEATHFNPVDIVCGVKDSHGNKFDLMHFVDAETAIIAKKSIQSKTVKGLELPGLWNGGMARWNTIFVEVPLVTFNPVKAVNDLLKDSHQVV